MARSEAELIVVDIVADGGIGGIARHHRIVVDVVGVGAGAGTGAHYGTETWRQALTHLAGLRVLLDQFAIVVRCFAARHVRPCESVWEVSMGVHRRSKGGPVTAADTWRSSVRAFGEQWSAADCQ